MASEIFEMTISKKGKGKALAREMLESGKAWKKFQEIIKAQNGRVKEIIPSKISHTVCSPKKGKIKDIDNHLINYLARVAGCPMDKYSGVYLHHHIGDKVKHNEPLLTIYAESKPRLKEALKYYENKKPIRI